MIGVVVGSVGGIKVEVDIMGGFGHPIWSWDTETIVFVDRVVLVVIYKAPGWVVSH